MVTEVTEATKMESLYVSAGCNKSPHALDWGFNNIICFASCNSIALYDPEFSQRAGRVFAILIGHCGRVTSVRWIKNREKDAERELISSSTDKSAIVWKKISDEPLTFVVGHHLQGHEETVTISDAMYARRDDGSETLIAVTASVDSTMKIWQKCDKTSMCCSQTINCNSGFALDVKFASLPNTHVPLLAAAMDNSTIALYAEQDSLFQPLHTVLRGHEDWVRSIDCIQTDEGDLLLASGSQDCFIRIWKISSQMDCNFDAGKSIADLPASQEIQLKSNVFSIQTKNEVRAFTVGLEAILAGHENWVYGVHWQPRQQNGKKVLKLASASMDKTMILWSPDFSTDLWLEEVRVGEVGGNTLGYYGNQFSPDGKSIIAHGYQGAFHLWHLQDKTNVWVPGVTVSGHFDEVSDLAWDPDGKYLLTVSLDQTTRLHGPWIRKSFSTWHELARPQIHGHDICCVSVISRYKFISGADEKVLRAFEAPKKFVENFSRLCGLDLDVEHEKLTNKSLPEGASLPPLGLSNKAVFEVQSSISTEKLKSDNTDCAFTPIDLHDPPTEEALLQNTLWPEVQKLYGHGYEIYCVAANHEGTLVASACKASKPEYATILLWDVLTWEQVGKLSSHSLTITVLAFSPHDKYLLSVSRDRTWAVYQRNNMDNGIKFEKVAGSDKRTAIHSRIIWTCAWAPNSSCFFTGSRDKKVVAWSLVSNDDEKTQFASLVSPLQVDDAVTAVAVASVIIDDSFLVAVGLESGNISLYWCNPRCREMSWTVCHSLEKSLCHSLCVKRLAFCPSQLITTVQGTEVQLASCGSDFVVRVLKFKLEEFEQKGKINFV